MDDFKLRHWIYRALADTGRAPTTDVIGSRFDSPRGRLSRTPPPS